MESGDFSEKLISWYRLNKRDLPWRNTTDPYKVWLSEVILQQTRVDQGMSYYLKFVRHYPTVKHLALASEDEVLKLWQGLGYYSRARNLHHTAKLVMSLHKGIFPASFEELIALKGIGTYTASAISSFCSNEARAVVDGNVYRVLSRIFGIATPIDSTGGKKEFGILAEELLNKKDPATHNQAIMEFGALQCQPRNPACESCPMQHSCYAYANKGITTLPVKSKKTAVSTRYFEYFIFKHNKSVYIKKRTGDDIWKNLYDFPLLESGKALTEKEVMKSKEFVQYTKKAQLTIGPLSSVYKHVLSHQHIYARFWQIELGHELKEGPDWKKVALNKLHTFAWPRLIDKFIDKQLPSNKNSKKQPV